MDVTLIDEYVLLVLKSNGWAENRNWPLADDWIDKIEKGNFRCTDYARKLLHSLGGLKVKEHSPTVCQIFLNKYSGDVNRIEEEYLRPLKILERLKQKPPVDKYTGATFTFDALDAFYDQEIVMDIKTAESVIGESLFPIGTIAPDGITYVTPKGCFYTLFNDSIYFTGDCIENYLNIRFIKDQQAKQIY